MIRKDSSSRILFRDLITNLAKNKKAKSIRSTIKSLDLSSQIGNKRVNYMKFSSLSGGYSSKRMSTESNSGERRITEGSKTKGQIIDLRKEAETKITSMDIQIQPLNREEVVSRKIVKLSHFVDATKSSFFHHKESIIDENERLQSVSSSFSSMSYSSRDNLSENNDTDEFIVSLMRKVVWGSNNLGQIRTMQALNTKLVLERSPNKYFNFTKLTNQHGESTKLNPRFSINLNNVKPNDETTGTIYIYIYYIYIIYIYIYNIYIYVERGIRVNKEVAVRGKQKVWGIVKQKELSTSSEWVGENENSMDIDNMKSNMNNIYENINE